MKSARVAGMSIVMLAALAPSSVSAASKGDPYQMYQWGLAAISAPQAWRYSTGRGVTVAVIDEGVDHTNIDLRGKVPLIFGPGVSCRPTRQRCGKLYIGKHGTMIAGIIGARRNNGWGLAGVAPDVNIIATSPTNRLRELIPVAVKRGARVLNMSFGYALWRYDLRPVEESGRAVGVSVDDEAALMHEALDRAWRGGAVLVGAAGNDGVAMCDLPASHENVICVGALDRRGVKAAYSNYGVGLDLVAPGGSAGDGCPSDQNLRPVFSELMVSTSTGNTFCGIQGLGEGFGTSYAAPHVSGVAALLVAKGLTNKQVVACLYRTADDLGAPGYDPIYGHGRVNAYRAVRTCRR